MQSVKMEGLKCLRRWLSLSCLALELNVRPSPPSPPHFPARDSRSSSVQMNEPGCMTIYWSEISFGGLFSISDDILTGFDKPASGHLIFLCCILQDACAQRWKFHISHDASRLFSVFSPQWKERSSVSREIFNDLNFKMQLIQGKFQWALLIFGIWLII